MVTILGLLICLKYEIDEINPIGFIIIDLIGIMVTGVVLTGIFVK